MNLELKLPPPVVAALCAGTMAAIAAVVPAATWPVPMQVALAWLPEDSQALDRSEVPTHN